jgi:hypothetical protein
LNTLEKTLNAQEMIEKKSDVSVDGVKSSGKTKTLLLVLIITVPFIDYEGNKCH